MLNAHGRLNGINKDAVTEKTLASLRQLGLDEQEIEEVRSEARPFVLFDYVSAIARNVARENLTSEQNQKWRDFSGDRLERIGREVPPDDLKNFLASIDLLNEERLALIEDYHYYWINTRHRRPEVWERLSETSLAAGPAALAHAVGWIDQGVACLEDASFPTTSESMPTYCITYHFAGDIPVEHENSASIAAYLRLGIVFRYKDNKIRSIEHTVSDVSVLSNEGARQQSRAEIRLLWTILEFYCGLLVVASRVYDKAIDVSGAAQGQATAILEMIASKPVLLPEQKILKNPLLRWHAWLAFFNEAGLTHSDAEAVRVYYNIVEDMLARIPKRKWDIEATALRHPRAFVGHGEMLRDPDALAFLAKELGPGTGQYDPNDLKHREFLRSQRERTRHYLENKLKQAIGLP